MGPLFSPPAGRAPGPIPSSAQRRFLPGLGLACCFLDFPTGQAAQGDRMCQTERGREALGSTWRGREGRSHR